MSLATGANPRDLLVPDMNPFDLALAAKRVGQPVETVIDYTVNPFCRTWPIRYLVRSKLSRATASSGPILAGRIDSNRSMSEAYLRSVVEKPAEGQNRSVCLPPMTRVSRWGTDIGGEPTDALP